MRELHAFEMDIVIGGNKRANDAIVGGVGTALGGGTCGLQGAAAGALAGAAMGPLVGNFVGQAISGACSNGYKLVPPTIISNPSIPSNGGGYWPSAGGGSAGNGGGYWPASGGSSNSFGGGGASSNYKFLMQMAVK